MTVTSLGRWRAGWWGAGGWGQSRLRAHPISQAGKFGLIPTLISLGTGAAWLGVVSAARVGKHAPGPPDGSARPGPRCQVWLGEA